MGTARQAILRIVLGGLAIGTLDLLFAIGFWALHGIAPSRIAQSIAAGLQGDAAFDGGGASAALGIVLHYFIATLFVLAYWLAGRQIPRLFAQPGRFGLAYGVLLYLAMNFVVLPLSAAGAPSFANVPWVVGSIAMHMFIGVLCAQSARRA